MCSSSIFRRILAAALLSALLGWLLLSWGRLAAPRPSILLVTVDTLRADELGAYGSPLGSSRALDRLARQSTLYSVAVAPSPWTLPSMGSLMTGLPPKVHGAIRSRHPLPDVPTLAQKLQALGYHTAAAVAHFLVGPDYGFDRGFDRFERRLIPPRGRAAHQTVTSRQLSKLGIQLLRSAEPPFFLWLHYFDPHSRYMPHPPQTAEGMSSRELYRGEVRFTDRALGEVLAAADALPRPPVILVTADHGEQFFEHGGYHHTKALYQEVASVPLLVRAAVPAAGKVVDGPVRLLDLHQLVLEIAQGTPAPPLLPAATEAEPILLHCEQAADLRGLISGRYKLIQDRLLGKAELFDLLADPMERVDLARQRPELLAALQAELERRFDEQVRQGASLRGGTSPEIDEERREQLEQLGYAD